MKKLILIIGIMVFFIPSVLAQTEDPTPSVKVPTPTVTSAISEKEIKDLKDKIATKVAELNKNKKAVAGVVTEVSSNNFKLKSDDNKVFTVKIDSELTKAYQLNDAGKKEIKINDIKKDNYAAISGVLLDNTINANFIYLDRPVLIRSGKITEINKSDYTLKIMTTEKDENIITVENFTKQEILNIKTLDTERTGFSKIKEGDTIHFVVRNGENKEQVSLTALRYLVIPQEYFIK